MDLSGNDKNKITGKKYQPVMTITGLNDQGLKLASFLVFSSSFFWLLSRPPSLLPSPQKRGFLVANAGQHAMLGINWVWNAIFFRVCACYTWLNEKICF